ncbi:MAG: 6-phosphofructokinase, partial [Candidatus Treponema excrementipullorum]|nr:6-phosphofructokinase [Candidatus Treponema excrementipullorum]
MEQSKVKRFGILTSGGDAPGLNAAIRGVARTAMDEFGMEVIGIENGYRGLIEGKCRKLEPEDFSGILTRGGTILGTSREKPFKNYTIYENGKTAVDKIKENYKNWGLDALVILGGNGTNTTGWLLQQEGLNVIG